MTFRCQDASRTPLLKLGDEHLGHVQTSRMLRICILECDQESELVKILDDPKTPCALAQGSSHMKMAWKKEGQISIEYLIIVGFVTFLIVSVLGLGLFYSGHIRDRIKFNQLQNFANKVISSSEVVFFSGEPSRSTITAYLPSGIQDIQVLQDQIIFSVSSSSGTTVISFSSDVPLYGSISNSEGVKRIAIVANTTSITLGESST